MVLAGKDYSTRHSLDNLLGYVRSRELGRAFQRSHQEASDLVSSHRTLEPLIADTPTGCRSTYLLRINPTNKLLAAAHGDRSVAIYCASSGHLLAKCIGHERSPWTLAFHPSQPYLLASGCLGGSIRLWNLEPLSDLGCSDPYTPLDLSCTLVWKHAGAIASLAFHPVHPILAAAWTQEVVFYDWVSGRMLSVWRFVSDLSRVRWVRFSPDGALLYTATANPSASRGQMSASTSFQKTSQYHPSTSEAFCSQDSTNSSHEELGIPRDGLLGFLVTQPDSWFHQLGVCNTCSVRLCRWAGTLGPVFPSASIDIRKGTALAGRVAGLTATSMRLAGLPLSHVLQELIAITSGVSSSEVSEHLCADANPAAVAIIEDMPVREFLLSRGNYCSSPSTKTVDKGLCCGGHACDLVLAHRELMRHSICRPCLTAFWRWASKSVVWWHWSSREECPSGYLKGSDYSPVSKVYTDRPDFDHNNYFTDRNGHSSSQPPVGICLQCKAGVHMQNSKSSDNLTDASPGAFGQVHVTGVNVNDRGRPDSSFPLAALELLRSRLSNANEMTPVTYMATDLVTEGVLASHLRLLLRSELLFQTPSSMDCLPKVVLDLMQQVESAQSQLLIGPDSPEPKRRKLDSMASSKAVTVSSPDSNSLSCVDTYSSNSLSSSRHSDNSSRLPRVSSLAEEAATLGSSVLSASAQMWNSPRPTRLISKEGFVCPRLQLFSYVPMGVRLLRPRLSTVSSYQLGNKSGFSYIHDLRQSAASSPSEAELSEHASEACGGQPMTACCRCGRIVPQTFPIDPSSSLSAVVCKRFVLSDYKPHPINTYGSHPMISNARSSLQPLVSVHEDSRFSGSASISTSTCLTRSRNESVPTWSTSISTCPSGQPAIGTSIERSNRDGNMLYLINRTNADSILNAVHRSITEVIAGLFVDMGEHGSASCLQDTTYRICRWELNLCSPIENGCSIPSPQNRADLGCLPSSQYPRAFLPMPANVAVSYNTNSLVIPHARLFNDSSICLSPDGRMLAAFVVPGAISEGRSNTVDQGEETQNKADRKSSSMDTVLAVYRLQPELKRGQCLFMKTFVNISPVCLDFSPLGDFLAVGMATTRLPSASLPTSSLRRLSDPSVPSSGNQGMFNLRSIHGLDSDNSEEIPLPKRFAFVAQILHLDRSFKRVSVTGDRHRVRRSLKEVTTIEHPSLLNPVSSPLYHRDADSAQRDNGGLGRWHRLLISAPVGISLNTIVWNPSGGLFYGTTRGLIVIMQPQPYPIISTPRTPHSISSLVAGEDESVESSIASGKARLSLISPRRSHISNPVTQLESV
ncbi:unnamed protein product [Calicophoron daubneyi]|uniref:Activating molecule in BECN1-regulated autophagy protein 1 n=1 Tax=Calicophoron daubneyi TaxID=300641 RepID=A0AAV2TI18_CALDB